MRWEDKEVEEMLAHGRVTPSTSMTPFAFGILSEPRGSPLGHVLAYFFPRLYLWASKGDLDSRTRRSNIWCRRRRGMGSFPIFQHEGNAGIPGGWAHVAVTGRGDASSPQESKSLPYFGLLEALARQKLVGES